MNNIVEEMLRLHAEVDTTVDMNKYDLTPIQEFYNNTNVLITGCTGFLGHVLLEKLLRSCPVSKIFILIRKKKGKEIEDRLNEMFNEPVFQRIKNQFPERIKKVVPVKGDCVLPNLGIGDQDRKRLIDNVDIVFHVAATVRFDEKIKTAVHTNIRSSVDLLRMARQMPRLKSFLHVSTMYCNCNSVHKIIEEDVYPPAKKYDDILSLVDNTDEKILDKITPRLIEKYPNTYTYTKQIAEDVVKEKGQGLPVGIHRPAIVLATYKEPIRGWSSNIYGPTGVVLASALGILRVLHCEEKYNANVVPADMCVNSMIAAAWDVAETFKKSEEEKSPYKAIVYNYESSNDKPITWKQFMDYNEKYGKLIPPAKSIWCYSFVLQKSYLLYLILRFLLHTIPAILVDIVLFCLGKPTIMLKTYKKIHKFSNVISFFCTNEWVFNSNNVQKVIQKMTDRDSQIFFSDMKKLDWNEFYKSYNIGLRSYLAKDSVHTVPEAMASNRRKYWLHQGLKVVLGASTMWIIWALIPF